MPTTIAVSVNGTQGPPGPPGADGAPGGGWAHTVVGVTTPSIAAGATHSGVITMAVGYRLLRIDTSPQARVRLYTTATKRDADVGRPIGTDPTGDHGLVLEYVTTASILAADLSPTVDGFDGKATPDGQIPYTVTNTGAGAFTITVQLTWIRTE